MTHTRSRARLTSGLVATVIVSLLLGIGFYYFHFSRARQTHAYASRMKDVVGWSLKSGRVLIFTLSHESGTFRLRFLRSDGLSDVSRGDTLEKDTNSLLVHFHHGKKDLLLVMDPTDLY